MASKKESIFTNLEEFEQETYNEEDAEELVEIVSLPDIDDTVEHSKLELLKDLVGVKKTPLYEVLPTVALPTDTGGITRPKTLQGIHNCPRCGSVLKQAIAINGSESGSFKECPNCGTLINTFKPIVYQKEYMERTELYTMVCGGFGSGKSRIHIEQVIKHLILIPNARVVVAARTYPAIEATFVKDFFSIMPTRLLRKKNEQKREWVFTNGSELLLRSFDDPTKLRGINATMFVLLEASNLQYEAFELAQNRVRNTAALIPMVDFKGDPVRRYDEKAKMSRIVYAHDARKILIESNPDAGWIKTQFLLQSHLVSYYGSAYREGYRMDRVSDPNKFTMVTATDANPYLPENFIAEQTRGKSRAYIQQYFYGSFNFSENTVYPGIGGRIVPPKALPPEYDERGRRALWYIIGLDYGVNDPLAIIYAAFSTITRKLYFFDEIYKTGLSVKEAVAEHRLKLKQHNITNEKLLTLPLFDGRSYNKREANLVTIGALFNHEGLYFKPSFTFIDARIAKFSGIINEEQIEVFSTCEFFIEEITNYKYKPNKDGSISDKPYDKNNHAINAGEFIIMELPLDLNNINILNYVPTGMRHMHNADENIEKQSMGFNPYEGGNTNGRNSTRNLNNPYSGSTRPKSLYAKRPQELEEEHAESGNIFQAYIPRRSK